ncbi:MAG: hypothetical protein LBT42_01915 [Tannerella sp.]|jgi:hypothetical protein|nr:hypothetical protein [Tannerella sp.]
MKETGHVDDAPVMTVGAVSVVSVIARRLLNVFGKKKNDERAVLSTEATKERSGDIC